MPPPPTPLPLPTVTLIKAVAPQLIVWHHLVFYGPLSDVVYPHASALFDWFYEYARMAVQAFLVMGGYLAGRALYPRLGQLPTPAALLPLLWQRYLRLVRPYLWALLAAIAAAAWARTLVSLPSVPPAPEAGQLLAHALLLQGVLGVDALSAGVWYVAIDFQLYLVLAVLLWLPRKLLPTRPGAWVACTDAAVLGLLVASLFGFNRASELDDWAVYFFGAYGLGVLAQRASARPWHAAAALALLVGLALWVEWRTRILVAGLSALALALGTRWRWSPGPAVRFLERISYELFLVHYPVFLGVSAFVHRCWPTDLVANTLGMFATWGLSLGAAVLLHRLVQERQAPRGN